MTIYQNLNTDRRVWTCRNHNQGQFYKYEDCFLLTNIQNSFCTGLQMWRQKYLPTAPMCPFSAAIISGVFPELSAAFTCALWLKRSCKHSTWSAKAAAWSGVLRGNKVQLHISWHGRIKVESNLLSLQTKYYMLFWDAFQKVNDNNGKSLYRQHLHLL